MDMSKVNMHKRLAMTGHVPKHFRGGGLALKDGGLTGAELKDRIGRSLGRRTKDAEGRTLMRPKAKAKKRKHLQRQGYKAREDESLGKRTGRESGKKQSMKDRRDESYGKWGKRPQQRINRARGGRVNTRRENILEEKGRVDAEKAYTKGGKERLGAEQRRLAHELGKKEGGFLARRKKLAGFGAAIIAAKLRKKKSKKRKK